jgi:hypothetical protein
MNAVFCQRKKVIKSVITFFLYKFFTTCGTTSKQQVISTLRIFYPYIICRKEVITKYFLKFCPYKD